MTRAHQSANAGHIACNLTISDHFKLLLVHASIKAAGLMTAMIVTEADIGVALQKTTSGTAPSDAMLQNESPNPPPPTPQNSMEPALAAGHSTMPSQSGSSSPAAGSTSTNGLAGAGPSRLSKSDAPQGPSADSGLRSVYSTQAPVSTLLAVSKLFGNFVRTYQSLNG